MDHKRERMPRGRIMHKAFELICGLEGASNWCPKKKPICCSECREVCRDRCRNDTELCGKVRFGYKGVENDYPRIYEKDLLRNGKGSKKTV